MSSGFSSGFGGGGSSGGGSGGEVLVAGKIFIKNKSIYSSFNFVYFLFLLKIL